MASLVVPLFLTPPARAIGRARRGATGMAGRAVLAWSNYRQGRASSARGPPLTSSGGLADRGPNEHWKARPMYLAPRMPPMGKPTVRPNPIDRPWKIPRCVARLLGAEQVLVTFSKGERHSRSPPHLDLEISFHSSRTCEVAWRSRSCARRLHPQRCQQGEA